MACKAESGSLPKTCRPRTGISCSGSPSHASAQPFCGVALTGCSSVVVLPDHRDRPLRHRRLLRWQRGCQTAWFEFTLLAIGALFHMPWNHRMPRIRYGQCHGNAVSKVSPHPKRRHQNALPQGQSESLLPHGGWGWSGRLESMTAKRKTRKTLHRSEWTDYLVPRTISPLHISAEAAVPARLDKDKPNGPLCSVRGSGTAFWYSPLSFPGSPAAPLGSFQLRPDHCPLPRHFTEHPGLHEIVKRANALMECLALEVDVARASGPAARRPKAAAGPRQDPR